MEIKHTIEILTKDIQDIEKLVRNLNNYETPPQIEIDLAMSRLRNVYDLLSLISNDLRSDQLARQQQAPENEQAPQPPQSQAAASKEPEVQEPAPPQPQAAASKEPEVQEPAPPQPQPTPPPVSSEKPADPPPREQQSPQSAADLKPEGSGDAAGAEQKKKEEVKKTSILAEKFASDKSLNEKISPGSGHDLSSKLTGEPIDSIKRNIGINDRFLIIRELLDGDNEAFNALVQKLDTQQRFDEAYEIIQSLFPDQMEHDGVNLLVRLSRRRYLGR